MNKKKNKIKAAFFDRDGTLIYDVNYLHSVSQVSIIPGSIALCTLLQRLNYRLIMVTNQSGVARGFFDEQRVTEVNAYVIDLFAVKGISFLASYYCPHHPTQAAIEQYNKVCTCRKPAPGMLLQAAQDYNIDLSQSIMIGDKESDIQAGQAAGCRSFFIQDLLEQSEKEQQTQLI